MAQRQILRSACRAFAECQTSLRSAASSNHSGASALSRSALGKLKSSVVSASSFAPCSVMMKGLGGVQVSALPSAVPMGFAASAPSVCATLTVSATQSRGVSTTASALEGDGEEEEPTYLRPPVAGLQTSLTSASKSSSSEDEPPDLRAGLRPPPQGSRPSGREPRRSDGPPGRRPQSSGRGDDASEAELVAAARDVFTRLPESARGPLPSLPREVREALYGHRWDRVLVDVRRSVERRPLPGGKEEIYTAMVATGNMAGIFGLGLGVADTAQLAVARAHLDSYSRLTAVPLYRGHTIYHQLDHSFHRMQIQMFPRPEGWGLRCCDLMYELCNVVGIRNATIQLRGRVKNKFYVAQCFQEALLKQTTPHDGVEATGMYVREVYNRKELPYGLKRGVDVL